MSQDMKNAKRKCWPTDLVSVQFLVQKGHSHQRNQQNVTKMALKHLLWYDKNKTMFLCCDTGFAHVPVSQLRNMVLL